MLQIPAFPFFQSLPPAGLGRICLVLEAQSSAHKQCSHICESRPRPSCCQHVIRRIGRSHVFPASHIPFHVLHRGTDFCSDSYSCIPQSSVVSNHAVVSLRNALFTSAALPLRTSVSLYMRRHVEMCEAAPIWGARASRKSMKGEFVEIVSFPWYPFIYHLGP
jgi:hypothetical protein